MSEYASIVLQVVTGTFFIISGYHKLFNKKRHKSLVKTLRDDNIPFIKFNQWWVPGWEFVGGIGLLVTSGYLADFFAAVLLIICVIASCTDGWKRVQSWHPIDMADMIDDVLYLPEVLLSIMLIVIIIL